MHEAGSVLDQYLDLLGNQAHWLFEITLMLLFDVLIGVLLWPLAKRWIRRHDQEHHLGHTSDDDDDSKHHEMDGAGLWQFRQVPLPIKGQEWHGLVLQDAVAIPKFEYVMVRINEDGTVVIRSDQRAVTPRA